MLTLRLFNNNDDELVVGVAHRDVT